MHEFKPNRAIRSLSNIQRFYREFREFCSLAKKNPRFTLCWDDIYPKLWEREVLSGFDKHYFYHLAWAARILAKHPPAEHIDISSDLRFYATISAFFPVQFYEFHPSKIELDNIKPGVANLVSLPFGNGQIDSLSCMHVVEHIGLGRYGDAIDPDGDVKAMNELQRVLAPGGRLLFVVPVGKSKVAFNAHRIYSFQQVSGTFSNLELKEFSLIPDDSDTRGLILNAPPELVEKQLYACGCFLFQKESE
ncbi:MAG: DUF268 domain-containing protein [Proteobacteria bacterium]|nr:DUF268 domain-containing protein [Pseudomonadota bacterium]